MSCRHEFFSVTLFYLLNSSGACLPVHRASLSQTENKKQKKREKLKGNEEWKKTGELLAGRNGGQRLRPTSTC